MVCQIFLEESAAVQILPTATILGTHSQAAANDTIRKVRISIGAYDPQTQRPASGTVQNVATEYHRKNRTGPTPRPAEFVVRGFEKSRIYRQGTNGLGGATLQIVPVREFRTVGDI